ncbi:MAG: phosphohistidine phosphatase SixA [Polyangiaceae bacterium]|nr:phosphohistidine phosphatase SixA [Polyangiaceae bacterium]
MKLYVMRHGPAEDTSPTKRDADRALTESGRNRVHAVARTLAEHGEAPFVILSSPLVRAFQTAEIVASVTGLAERVASEKKARSSGAKGSVEMRLEMAPGGDQMGLVSELVSAGRKRVMIVGHEPDLGVLVARLIGEPPREGMLKAMVVGLKLTPNAHGADFSSKLRFVLHPKTLAWRRG